MARSIWSGIISFGMVSIPVKLFTATESRDISFNQLHNECHGRVKQLRWCPIHEREVAFDELERGYEYTKGQYVVLTDEDFQNLPLPSKRTIELAAFVDESEIDPIFYEKTYYLEPDEMGRKPMALLLRTMEQKGLTAIAKIAIRNKERLCALRVTDGTLMLETLYFPDEIRAADFPERPDIDVSEQELAMASSLVDLLAKPFAPEEFHDTYREALMATIEAKIQGQEIAEVPEAPAAGVIDLMAALKASVDAAKQRKDATAAAEPVAPPSRRRKAAG